MNNIENIAELFPIISWIAFAGVLLFFSIISLILNYHWNKYGASLRGIKLVKKIYFGISGLLLAAMLILLYSIQA